MVTGVTGLHALISTNAHWKTNATKRMEFALTMMEATPARASQDLLAVEKVVKVRNLW